MAGREQDLALGREEAVVVDRAPREHGELEDHALDLVREAARGQNVGGGARKGTPVQAGVGVSSKQTLL